MKCSPHLPWSSNDPATQFPSDNELGHVAEWMIPHRVNKYPAIDP